MFLGDVYRIGSSAFAECASLTSFTLPAGLEILGDQPFLGTNIREVTISRDARISQAGLAAFYGMPVTQYVVEEGSKYFSAQDGVLYDKAGYKLIAYPAGKIVEEGGTIRFPKGVRVIGENAFAGFSNTAADSSAVYSFTIDLTGIEIIEDYAFFGVGTLGFSGMQTSVQVIANVTVTGTQDLRVIGVGAFEQSYITSFVFHEGLREIGMNAFCATPVLKGDIVLPDSLTVLGDGAFTQNGTMAVSDQETGTLSYVSFRDYLRDSVGDGVTITNLSDFGGITSVTFGSGLKEAGATAFMNCHDLESADGQRQEDQARMEGLQYG